ncbi:cell wall-binding repeat-containing protein [Kineococcus sp. SYSU DK006]|uniref:cell wall-binding repeat-containing protein n=1 Tax=Kineococcus sp. SYSU DK006 TaxID=3383127 RepID=UPI003D7C5412
MGSATAATGSASGQIGGSDRYETAALIARTYWSAPSTVIVANGESGVDALTASYLAGVEDAPVLLTPAKQSSAHTVEALKALNPKKVVVIGGENAVSPAVYAELTAGRTAQRITGADRYETAANIVQAAGGTPASAFLAVGSTAGGGLSADALAAGPVAYRAHIPILLTRSGDLPAATAAALAGTATTAAVATASGTMVLKAAGGLGKVVVVGGGNAVSEAVRNRAAEVSGAATTRVAGADRSGTAAQLAKSAEAAAADFSTTTVSVVNGASVDGLTAGPAAGKRGAPMLLTNSATDLGSGTRGFLAEHAGTLKDVTVIGGASAVPPALVEAISTSSGVPVPAAPPTVVATPTPVPTAPAPVAPVVPTTPTVPSNPPVSTTPTSPGEEPAVPDLCGPRTTEPAPVSAQGPRVVADRWWPSQVSPVVVAANQTLQAGFDESLSSSSTATLRTVEGGLEVDADVQVSGSSIDVVPRADLVPGTRYAVTFTAVSADDGVAADPATMEFTAAPSMVQKLQASLAQQGPASGSATLRFELDGVPADDLVIDRFRRGASAEPVEGGMTMESDGVTYTGQRLTIPDGELADGEFIDEGLASGEYVYIVNRATPNGCLNVGAGTGQLQVTSAAVQVPTLDGLDQGHGIHAAPGVTTYTLTGTAAPGATVVLDPINSWRRTTTTADADGRWSFEIPVTSRWSTRAAVRAYDTQGNPSAQEVGYVYVPKAEAQPAPVGEQTGTPEG